MILMSQNALLDERDEAALDEWYLEHLRAMSSVPGIHSAQRFKTSTPGFSRSLGMYSIGSEQAFDNPYYRSIRGMGDMASRIDERQHHVNLFAGLDAAPLVGDGDELLLLDAASPQADTGDIEFAWLECVGRDFSTPYRGIAVVAADRKRAFGNRVAVYRPVTGRYIGTP